MSKPTILVAEDDPAIRLVVSQTLSSSGYAVRATASPDALFRWIRDGEGDVVVTDVYLGDDSIFEQMPDMRQERPDLPFIVMSGQNTVLTAASAADHGAFDYLPKPFDIDELSSLVSRALRRPSTGRRVSRELLRAEESASLPMIGRSEAMQSVYRSISRVMNTDFTVLLTGKAGTGKELAARAIHSLGKRKTFPFCVIDPDGPSSDISLMLRDVGGGIIYVDEVGELSPAGQSKLLDIMRQSNDAQVIASTRHSLLRLIEEGSFRPDLYYRLGVLEIAIPSLQERKEDIPELAKAFVARSHEYGGPARTIDDSAIDLLMTYEWPGNVRQLENLIHRLNIFCADAEIGVKDVEKMLHSVGTATVADEGGFDDGVKALIGKYIMAEMVAASAKETPGKIHQRVIEAVERPLIDLALSVTSGNKVRAAGLLGVNRNTLRAKITAFEAPSAEEDAKED